MGSYFALDPKRLIKNTSHIVIATDADREGELIARELMDHCQFKGQVERLWLSALDDASIRKSLKSIKPGSETVNLYYAGLGRQRADWLVGMNMTMATSSLFGKYGDGVLSVGRVQTPTLQLIVNRDLDIEHFQPQDHYELYAHFIEANGTGLWLKWMIPKKSQDNAGRCLNIELVRLVAGKINNKPATVLSFDKKKKKQPPPIPFTLSSLQKKASTLYGFSAKKTLSIAQELYEKYKATSYPRTDSGYLPLSQHVEAEDILSKLAQSDQSIAALIGECDSHLKSPAWNDKKVTAHHGIIPTSHIVNPSLMSNDIKKIYNLIRLVYIAQFLGDYVYKNSKLMVDCENEKFTATGNIPLVRGWKKALSQAVWGSESKGKNETKQDLPDWEEGQQLTETGEKIARKKTKPLARFTEGTLIGAMESIGKYVEDPKLKKILKETSGIGTQATRASIIELLINREFVIKNKKQLQSTEKGRALVSLLPEVVKDPATTALWEQNLEDVAGGMLSLEDFLKRQKSNLNLMLAELRRCRPKIHQSEPQESETSSAHQCTTCSRPMARRRSKQQKSFFWGCTGYPECKLILPDYNGSPGVEKITAKKSEDKCAQCETGYLIERRGKYGNFYGCSKYPKCNYITKK